MIYFVDIDTVIFSSFFSFLRFFLFLVGRRLTIKLIVSAAWLLVTEKRLVGLFCGLIFLWILIGHKMYHFLKLFSVRYLSPYLLGKYVIPFLILFYLIFYNVDCRVLCFMIWLYNIIFPVYFCQFVHIHNFLRTALKWLIYYLKFIIRPDVHYRFLYYLIAILATFPVS